MLWWIGAVALLVMAVPCGVQVGRRLGRGEAKPWHRSVAGWLVGWHGAVGVVALWMITQAVA